MQIWYYKTLWNEFEVFKLSVNSLRIMLKYIYKLNECLIIYINEIRSF